MFVAITNERDSSPERCANIDLAGGAAKLRDFQSSLHSRCRIGTALSPVSNRKTAYNMYAHKNENRQHNDNEHSQEPFRGFRAENPFSDDAVVMACKGIQVAARREPERSAGEPPCFAV